MRFNELAWAGDNRAKVPYELVHLPGAINIPIPLDPEDDEQEIVSVKLLVIPRDKLIILY